MGTGLRREIKLETKLSYEDTASVGFEEVIREERKSIITYLVTDSWTLLVWLRDQINLGRDSKDKSLAVGAKSGSRCVWGVIERTGHSQCEHQYRTALNYF
ncbi:UNVERIFIED_CONTAM: hypothetical protein K2H54_020190 [Gekko kuhli]